MREGKGLQAVYQRNIWVGSRTFEKKNVLPCPKLFSKNESLKGSTRDFPGGAVVRNPPANAGDMGSSHGLGRSHMPQSS